MSGTILGPGKEQSDGQGQFCSNGRGLDGLGDIGELSLEGFRSLRETGAPGKRQGVERVGSWTGERSGRGGTRSVVGWSHAEDPREQGHHPSVCFSPA